jgi:hypothetical protein
MPYDRCAECDLTVYAAAGSSNSPGDCGADLHAATPVFTLIGRCGQLTACPPRPWRRQQLPSVCWFAGCGAAEHAARVRTLRLTLYLLAALVPLPALIAFEGTALRLALVATLSSSSSGGLFNIHVRGSGNVPLLSDGEPVRLDVSEAPTFGDPPAAIAWSGGVSTSLKTDVQVKTMLGLGSGESFQLGFSGKGWVLVQPSEAARCHTSDRFAGHGCAEAREGRVEALWKHETAVDGSRLTADRSHRPVA